MKRTGLILLISAYWLLVSGFSTPIHAQDETLTLITYYPAPYGVYTKVQIGSNPVNGITLEPSDVSPNAGYIRFGDNTGWRLYIGRYKESAPAAPNTGATGVLMTVQDNGNIGIGLTAPTNKLHIVGRNDAIDNIVFMPGTDTPAGGTPDIRVGVGTTTVNSRFTIYEPDESTTQTNFTQSLTNGGINIATDYTANAYTPGIFWSTQNNNSTKPKGGIYVRETDTGSNIFLGTSNSYATGITSNVTIDPDGNMAFNNMPSISYSSNANYYIKNWDSFTWDDAGWDDIGSATNWTNIFRLTVSIPSSGFLLVQATGNMMMDKGGGDEDEIDLKTTLYYRMAVGISEVSSGAPPAGAYAKAQTVVLVRTEEYPYAVSRVYSVEAGTKNFYVVGFMDTVTGSEPRFQVTGSIQAIFSPVSLETSTYNY